MELGNKPLLALLSLLGAGPAAALMCTTSSTGIAFVSRGYDVNSVSAAVMNDCQGVSFTSNSECRQNLVCGDYLPDPYPSGQVTCFARSAGLPYERSGSVESLRSLVQGTLNDCTSSAYTSNSECRASLACQDTGGGYAPPPGYGPPPSYPVPPAPGYGPPPSYPVRPAPGYGPPPRRPVPPRHPPSPGPGYGDHGGSCATVTLCVDKQTEVTIADNFLNVSNTKSLSHESCPAQFDGVLVVRSSYGEHSIGRNELPARFPLPGRVESYQKLAGRAQIDGSIENGVLRVRISDGRDGAGVYSFNVCTAR